MIITGIKNTLEDLDVDINNIYAAFSFYNKNLLNNNVYPDSWATGSVTGILNKNNNFYNYSGSGYFDGSTYMYLNGKEILNNSLIFLSYKKQRVGNEILLTSFTGNFHNNYSGFLLGVNDANKLYFSYWNNVEGCFTFIYENILSDKNLICLTQNDSVVSIGKYNNNTFAFDVENFNVYQNVFVDNNNLYLGGSPFRNNLNNDCLNFSGIIDKFFIIKDYQVFPYKDQLALGLYSNIDNINLFSGNYCFSTGYYSGSGYYYSGILENYLSGYETIKNEITGYKDIISGYTYYGLTGYEKVFIGYSVDNCGNIDEIYSQNPLSGFKTDEIIVRQELTGLVKRTGVVEIINSGIKSGIEYVWVSGQYCSEDISNLSEYEDFIDINYLHSLSYNQMSLLKTVDTESIIEVYLEPYSNNTLKYNENLLYDSLNTNYFYIDKQYQQNEILMFGNGQALIDSGYELIQNGYETIRSPNLDYFITGDTIETNKFFGEKDYLFYDYFSGKFYALKNTGDTINLPINLSNNYWVFKNGQKLIEGTNNDYIKSPWLIKQSFTGASGNSAFNTNFLNKIAMNNDASIIFLGANLDGEGGYRAGKIEIYTGSKNLGWKFKQKILGTSIDSFLSTKVFCSSNGKVLFSKNLSSGNIFTGDYNNNYSLSSFNINHDIGNATLNNSGNIIIVSSNRNSNQSFIESNSGIIDIYTGNPNLGIWNLKQSISGRISGNLQINNITDDGTLFLATEYNYIPSGSGYLYSGNPILGWNLKQSFSLSGRGQLNEGHRINNNGDILALSNSSGLIQLYTGNLNTQWNKLNDIYIPPTPSPNPFSDFIISLSDDKNLLFITNRNSLWSSETNIYKINPLSLLQSFNTDRIISSYINNNGNVFGLGSLNFNDQRGFIDIYVGEPFKLFLNNTNINEENFIIFKEFPSNFIYITGNSGTLNLQSGFNNGCSQVYYNGIKQKINSNYIENSNFDLISGIFYENKNLNIIYNNTDNFFTIV